MRLRLAPEATDDVSEAARWYRDRQAGLDRRFLDAFEAALASIERNPELGHVIEGRIRRVLLRGFPFGVFYVLDPDELLVLACLHGARNPQSWRRRAAR